MPRPRASELAAPPAESSTAVRARVVAAPRAPEERDSAANRGGVGAPVERGRPAAALGSRPGAGGARRSHDRRARRRRRRRAGTRRGGALVSHARRSSRGVNEIRRVRRRDPAFPPLLAAIHDPPPRLFLRGSAAVRLLSEPAVAVVGARACSSYGRSVARSLARELAASGARRRERHGARHRRRGAPRRAWMPAAGPSRSSAAESIATIPRPTRSSRGGSRERARRLGVRARYRARSVAVPGPKPDHRRSVRGDRRRRGARAKRRAHHGRLRARGGPRRARRTRRDHELAVRRLECAAPARRGAGDVRGGRARAVRPRAAPSGAGEARACWPRRCSRSSAAPR